MLTAHLTPLNSISPNEASAIGEIDQSTAEVLSRPEIRVGYEMDSWGVIPPFVLTESRISCELLAAESY